jgi:hypothetical protein
MSLNDPIDLTAFKRLLAETVAWCTRCASLNDPKSSLRTLPLHTDDLSRMNQVDLKQIADSVFRERARSLKNENPDLPKNNLARGRLLICYPEESVWDGAAEAASMGFFDVADIPAWDTWCYYGIETKWEPTFFIVSWVPSDFTELTQWGIDVNPVECIQWASRFDNTFTRSLKTEGLL